MVATAFVGRERELEILDARFVDAAAGNGCLILVSGEPGIGKTRLADEAARLARRRGMLILRARCHEGEGAPAFWPWTQLLQTAVEHADADVLDALSTAGSELAQLVPGIGKRLPPVTPSPALDAPAVRFRLFHVVADLLGRLAEQFPVLIVIDDLHAADHPSLLLLRFVVECVADTRVVVVATHREMSDQASNALGTIVPELLREPGTERIALGGLGPDAVRAYVAQVMHVPPSDELSRRLQAVTEGNPLFLGEYVRVLLEEGRNTGTPAGVLADGVIPATVRGIIERRLAAVSPDCRAALGAAAVIGRDFDEAMLQRVLRTPRDENAPTTLPLARVLGEASAAALVERGTARRHRFAHVLVRDVLYDELEPTRRADLHRAVAGTMMDLPDPDAVAAQIAHHLFSAGTDADRCTAIDYARRAADHALSVSAYEDAARLYELALEALDGTRSDEALRCDLLVGLGDAQTRAGRFAVGEATLLQAADLARRLRLHEPLMRIALHFGPPLWAGYRLDDPHHAALLALLEEAMAACSGDSPTHVRLLARYSVMSNWAQPREVSVSTAAAALAMADRVGDAVARATALWAVHYLWDPADIEARLSAAAEMVRVATRTGDTPLAFEGHYLLAADFLQLGHVGTAAHEISICTNLAERLGQPLYVVPATALRVTLAALRGSFAEAERALSELLPFADGTVPEAQKAFAAHLFALQCWRGDVALFEPGLRGHAETYASIPGFRCSLAYLYRELERRDAASRELARLSARDFTDLPRDVNWLHSMTLIAEVCAFVEDVPCAQHVYRLLLPHAQEASVMAAVYAYFGPVAHYLGLLAAVAGAWDDADRHFRAAIDSNVRNDALPWLARTEYEYAAMLARRDAAGDRDRARALLARARSTADQLGLRPLAVRVRGLEERMGATPQGAEAMTDQRVAPAVARVDAVVDASVFRRDGEYWTATFAGSTSRFRDSKGLRYIARLLAQPGRGIHVRDLSAQVVGATVSGPDDVPSSPGSGLGPALDARAASEYRGRLRELRATLEEATAAGDLGRRARIESEIDYLTQELSAAYGLGGRARPVGDPSERLRKAVGNQIRRALDRIAAEHPALARHFDNAVRTGFVCSYTPEQPIDWRL